MRTLLFKIGHISVFNQIGKKHSTDTIDIINKCFLYTFTMFIFTYLKFISSLLCIILLWHTLCYTYTDGRRIYVTKTYKFKSVNTNLLKFILHWSPCFGGAFATLSFVTRLCRGSASSTVQ